VYVFFCNALYIHSNGAFQNGAKHHVLVFYRSVHLSFDFAQDHELVEWHPFETPLNGPLFWAFDKKRHTHAPSQVLRPSFLELSEAFYESHNGHYERVKGLFTKLSIFDLDVFLLSASSLYSYAKKMPITNDVKYQYEKSGSSFHLGELLTLQFQGGNNRGRDSHLIFLVKTERGIRAV